MNSCGDDSSKARGKSIYPPYRWVIYPRIKVTKTQTISNQRFITKYNYDKHGKMISMTYPSGKVIGYAYDDKGELVSIAIDGVPFIKDIRTNDNGLLSYTYADGSKHIKEYDTTGNIIKDDKHNNDVYATAIARIIYYSKPGKIYDYDMRFIGKKSIIHIWEVVKWMNILKNGKVM